MPPPFLPPSCVVPPAPAPPNAAEAAWRPERAASPDSCARKAAWLGIVRRLVLRVARTTGRHEREGADAGCTPRPVVSYDVGGHVLGRVQSRSALRADVAVDKLAARLGVRLGCSNGVNIETHFFHRERLQARRLNVFRPSHAKQGCSTLVRSGETQVSRVVRNVPVFAGVVVTGSPTTVLVCSEGTSASESSSSSAHGMRWRLAAVVLPECNQFSKNVRLLISQLVYVPFFLACLVW